MTTTPASLLVVDDNEANRDVLSRRLRQRGYTVAVAGDGPSAVAMCAATPFDLILLDVEMPGMSGLEVLAKLREKHSRTELPVIMVTARASGTDVVEALNHGANDYVTKPIDFPVAVARIETHLSHKMAVAKLRESEERYTLAIRGANDGLWDWNLLTEQVHWSPRWRAMLGLENVELAGYPEDWLSRIHPEDIAQVTSTLRAHLESGSAHFESEHRLLHRDETYRWVLCRGAAVRNEAGVATRFAGSFTDITTSKLADALTGLPNRFLFLDLVERAIKRVERRPQFAFAVLVLKVDSIQIIHDSLGPAAADQLLVAVARRLQSGLRSTDVVTREEHGFTLARLGGDEFNVLIDDISDAADCMLVADRLLRALQAPFEIDGQEVFASARLGIAVSTTGYTRGDGILRDATIALNRTTAASACEIFDPAMRQRAMARLKIESELRRAIEDGSLTMHYQPIVSLQSGRIAAFEALVRWCHPARGMVPPSEFIGVAEDTGLILDMGRLTLVESCRHMAAWITEFGALAPRSICANVSSRQLADTGLMSEVSATLAATGLLASKLKLEITESGLIDDVPAAQVTLQDARNLGIGWSLDDFGTGYSSLSLLHRLQVDTVKVDRSFVSAMGGGNGSEMVRAIVTLAHTLGMDVVAEGVETAEQAAELRALGCEYAQGFYFSKAVDYEAARDLIATQPWQTELLQQVAV